MLDHTIYVFVKLETHILPRTISLLYFPVNPLFREMGQKKTRISNQTLYIGIYKTTACQPGLVLSLASYNFATFTLSLS